MIEKIKNLTIDNFWFKIYMLSIILLCFTLFLSTNISWLLWVSGVGSLFFAMIAVLQLKSLSGQETLISKWLKMNSQQRLNEMFNMKIMTYYVSAMYSSFLLFMWFMLELNFLKWFGLILWGATGLLWLVSLFILLRTMFYKKQWLKLNQQMVQQRKNIVLQQSIQLSKELDKFVK